MKRSNENLHEVRSHRLAYGLFVDDGDGRAIPAGYNAAKLPLTYSSEDQAQKAIARMAMEKLRQFLRGELDFDDALHVEEYYAPVRLRRDGTILPEIE